MLLGLRRTSPMPPPFRSPSFSVVTIHMINESQCRSLPSSVSAALSSATTRYSFSESLLHTGQVINKSSMTCSNKLLNAASMLKFQFTSNTNLGLWIIPPGSVTEFYVYFCENFAQLIRNVNDISISHTSCKTLPTYQIANFMFCKLRETACSKNQFVTELAN